MRVLGISDARGRGFLGVSSEQGQVLQRSREKWVKKIRPGILKIGNTTGSRITFCSLAFCYNVNEMLYELARHCIN